MKEWRRRGEVLGMRGINAEADMKHTIPPVRTIAVAANLRIVYQYDEEEDGDNLNVDKYPNRYTIKTTTDLPLSMHLRQLPSPPPIPEDLLMIRPTHIIETNPVLLALFVLPGRTQRSVAIPCSAFPDLVRPELPHALITVTGDRE